MCAISLERRNATACRWAATSPRLPSVIICSTIGRTSLALASVVLMRPCSISAAARLAKSAFLCAASRPSFLPDFWCLNAPLFVPECQAVGLEGLADFLDRLLAEVGDRGELALRLGDEVADRLDADALEAVVAPHAELELLDREVLHPVRLGR